MCQGSEFYTAENLRCWELKDKEPVYAAQKQWRLNQTPQSQHRNPLSLPYLLKIFRKTKEKKSFFICYLCIHFFIHRVQAQSIKLIPWEKYTRTHLQAKSFYSRTNSPRFSPKLNFQLVLFEQKKTRNLSDKGKVGQSQSQQLTEPRMAQRCASGS